MVKLGWTVDWPIKLLSRGLTVEQGTETSQARKGQEFETKNLKTKPGILQDVSNGSWLPP